MNDFLLKDFQLYLLWEIVRSVHH